MERVTKLALGLTTLLSSSIACANFSFDNLRWDQWLFTPSVGIDANVRQQRFNTEFGDQHFRRDYPDTNVYFAARLHCYFGVEVGYEYMFRQNKTQFYNATAPVLGFVSVADSRKLYISNAYSNGWNVNLVGIWPVCPKTGTEMTFTLGVNWLKMFYDTVAVDTVDVVSEKSVWESDRRAKVRWGVGLKQMIGENFGTRLQIIWEKTSNLGATVDAPNVLRGNVPATSDQNRYTVEPRNNSILVGLGFFYQLC